MKGKKKKTLTVCPNGVWCQSCGPNFVVAAFLDISTKNLKE